MAQDYYDILQPFDYMVDLLEDNKAALGLRYVAQNDDDLLPEYPAVLVQADNTEREKHATQLYRVVFHMDIWIFHADLAVSAATRSRQDIELATNVRKLIHSKSSMDGHLIDSFIDGEFPGIAGRVIGGVGTLITATRLTWQGQNRVRYLDS